MSKSLITKIGNFVKFLFLFVISVNLHKFEYVFQSTNDEAYLV